MQDLIRDCFVTGNWDKSEDAKELLNQDGEEIKLHLRVFKFFQKQFHCIPSFFVSAHNYGFMNVREIVQVYM